MITNEDILNMNFYKKEKFTGSYRGMRYLIRKASVPEEDAESGADESGEAPQRDVFSVTIWRGPYNYDTTPEEEKRPTAFPSRRRESSRSSTGSTPSGRAAGVSGKRGEHASAPPSQTR